MTFCYDPDADFLDRFERHGFFDELAVHTAEVVVGDDALWEGAAQAWRRPRGAGGRGTATRRSARGGRSTPLPTRPFAAVRATLVREDEVDAEVLARPIAREAEVRESMRLLRAHLAGYACTAEESSAAVLSG